MGMLFSSLFAKVFGEREVRILILGLDNAGKTTILHKLFTPDKVVRTIPTVGFHVEELTYKNIKFSLWDLGGQTTVRPFWKCYLDNTDGIIYVVDSADKDRMDIARRELFNLLTEGLPNVHILVFANKQDQEAALTEEQVARALTLTELKDRRWHIQSASAVKGEGLMEGLDWLADTLSATDSTA